MKFIHQLHRVGNNTLSLKGELNCAKKLYFNIIHTHIVAAEIIYSLVLFQLTDSQGEKVLEWNEYMQKDAHKWIKDSNSLNIMITGKTGSGKTSLINGLVGKKVGEEGFGLVRGTSHVEPKKVAIRGVAVMIWDTPGLQDGTDEEDRYLAEMKQHCSDCHLYIYCVSMMQKRNDASEIRAMKRLTETFGIEFWKKVLVVLTFANTQEDLCPADRDPTEWFESRVKLWRDALSNTLTKDCGVEQGVVNRVVVIPAGYSQRLRHRRNPWVLPGIANWFHDFWKECYSAIDHHALPALLKANQHRFKKADEITDEELERLPIEEQPIPYSDATRMAKAGGLAVAGAAAGAGAGAGIGAVVGSVVGAIGGPPGAAAGALAGGALGTLIIDPIVIAVYWRYSRRKSSKK